MLVDARDGSIPKAKGPKKSYMDLEPGIQKRKIKRSVTLEKVQDEMMLKFMFLPKKFQEL